MQQVKIYTDGACSGNPGPGGYGVVLLYGDHQKELSGAYDNTTNNRMEILAAIIGLESLKRPCQVTLYSDSQYLVNAMTKGWLDKWQRNNWMRNKSERAKNVDLWKRLLAAANRHQVEWVWVKGHASNEMNNRCDQLAVSAIKEKPRQMDNPE
ncbi:ribonuclease HI [Peptococcaceae bacterium 1198_IL3148]